MTKQYERFKEGAPLPDTLGECVDLLKEVDSVRLSMQKKVDEVKKRVSEIREHLIRNIDTEKSKGVIGLQYTAKIKTKEQATIRDFGKLMSWVNKHGRWDMIQHRINQKPVMEMIEEKREQGKHLVGVETIFTKSLSITKN